MLSRERSPVIVNLYVDHMASSPPTSAAEVWNATRQQSKLYSMAASKLGLTPAEYAQFREALLDGRATYVTLPRRLDAMAGNRRGSVYVVRNARLTTPEHGWRIALADGNVVYVPRACGNLSVLHPPVVAHGPVPHYRPIAYGHYRPVVAAAPPETPVAVLPPAEAPAAVAAAPVAAPAAASVRGPSPFLFLIPAALAGIVAGVTQSSPHAVAPCSAGSNSMGACSTK